ncbi:PhoH family protein, partial [Candidatus Aerophobetes bacterium]|nr:PhoH family protein [Candidatus Aerophobetes bacterium]
MKVAKIDIKDFSYIPLLFGKKDENLKLIEKKLQVEFVLRDNCLKIKGEEQDVEMAKKLIGELMEKLHQGYGPDLKELQLALDRVKKGEDFPVDELTSEIVFTTARGKKIRPYTEGQRRYVRALKESEVVFVIGPAGTGKTYLAVAMAIASLEKGEVLRIILTRPTVEAGEKLGFLPGGLEEKVEPYLRPLYDALYEMLLAEKFHSFLERGIIEIAPLVYMRGRTLN